MKLHVVFFLNPDIFSFLKFQIIENLNKWIYKTPVS